MTHHDHLLPADATTAVTTALQAMLADLIDLQLQTKQAHWNVRGRLFKSVHEQLDEVAAALQRFADEVAERIVTLGVPADGRGTTVSQTSALPPAHAGFVSDHDAVHAIEERLRVLLTAARQRVDVVCPFDSITEDLLIGLVGELEKQLWMLRAQVK
jgi:starvation-inducible DNA-binding protein